MRTLKCRSCDDTSHKDGDGEFCKRCGSSDFKELQTVVEGREEISSPEPAEIQNDGCAANLCVCDTKHDAGDGICAYCDLPILEGAIKQEFVVTWPWGKMPIQERLLVGRVPPASEELTQHLELSYLNVSRCHAEFFIESGQLYLRDLDSMNGTYLNGSQMNKFSAMPLKPGDKVRFASNLETVISSER